MSDKKDPVIAIAQISDMILALCSGKDISPKDLHSLILRECARSGLGFNSVDYLKSYLTRKICGEVICHA